jgi:hypothetical protein
MAHNFPISSSPLRLLLVAEIAYSVARCRAGHATSSLAQFLAVEVGLTGVPAAVLTELQTLLVEVVCSWQSSVSPSLLSLEEQHVKQMMVPASFNPVQKIPAL